MATRIQQLSDYDCVLASLAMAVGANHWHEVWSSSDLDEVKGRGVSDTDTWLQKLGLVRKHHYINVYTHGTHPEILVSMLWRRRALLSVNSLNNEDTCHMVYWDGYQLFDPSPYRTYLHLHSMVMRHIILFDDAAIALDPPQLKFAKKEAACTSLPGSPDASTLSKT